MCFEIKPLPLTWYDIDQLSGLASNKQRRRESQPEEKRTHRKQRLRSNPVPPAPTNDYTSTKCTAICHKQSASPASGSSATADGAALIPRQYGCQQELYEYTSTYMYCRHAYMRIDFIKYMYTIL